MLDRHKFWLWAVVPLVISCHHHRADEVSERLRLDRIRLSARSALVGTAADSVQVTVAAVNESSLDQAIEISACEPSPLEIHAQHANKSWDSRAWEQSKVPVYRDSTGHVVLPISICSLVTVTLVPPGVSASYDRRISVRDILGDSLPPGRYKIRARVYINTQGSKGLPAGEIELRLPPT